MIPTSNDSDSLLLLVSQNGLYQKLLEQIKKDFELSGLSISIEDSVKTDTLATLLFKTIHPLILTNFEGYLQLLYRVDIPESSMQTNSIQNTEEFAKKATLLILKREWEKVYYRELYS